MKYDVREGERVYRMMTNLEAKLNLYLIVKIYDSNLF